MTGEIRGRGRPRKTESTYTDTRNDLIRSGLELLTQNGFLSTGVDAIVKNASVPKGSFYYYFKSKEEYAQTVLSAYDSFFVHKLQKHLYESSFTPMMRLENFIDDACDGIKKYNFTRGCLVGNMMQESPGLPLSFIKQLHEILERWQALVACCLSDALSSGEIRSDMPLIIIIKPRLSLASTSLATLNYCPATNSATQKFFGHIDGITQRINGGQAIQSGLR